MAIRTTHVGSLPRTEELLNANLRRKEMGETMFAQILQSSVNDVVARQQEIGIDWVNDGEYGHVMTEKLDFGPWWYYSFSRFAGLEMTDKEYPLAPPAPGSNIRLVEFEQRRDWVKFKDVYSDPEAAVMPGVKQLSEEEQTKQNFPVITGPIEYIGHDAVKQDIDALVSALEANGIDRKDGFIAAVSPGSAARLSNAYYDNDEEVVQAWAQALREEYRAITDAGLTVQIDDPSLAESWDQINPAPSFDDYRRYIQVRVDAINTALEGIDPDLVRLHLCWGSWHGPHTTDIPLKEIVDNVLTVNAKYISFEGANARHEHEWTVWREVDLPSNLVLVPGVVSHSTNVVEHPELVAQRISRFVDIVGPDRVVASTDCGFGGRIHPSIAWAKLKSLAEGAQLV
ncbi:MULTISPECIES: cobalamin-independent methionine synthase II family protein [Actinomycetaceae]|uniref:cobalamin-independent methionine synthase II family protein n=1 Tax=Actinomycetaceae TaxID=2049 RepID=UPI0008A240FD|nr:MULTISPECIES: cobalamin-independent methionine synthase II family protein [Actinomycetaceae]MDP9833836.1 5-methyltetrahydropteroyltriglutamate--homocysteine methyltransferase [Gleimia europaea]OFJ62568.1 methionine synthase [Actinomyces sp. HMSC075B09]